MMTPEPSEFSSRARGCPPEAAQELVEERIAREGRGRARHLAGVHVHHRGGGAAHHGGEGQLHVGHVAGRAAALLGGGRQGEQQGGDQQDGTQKGGAHRRGSGTADALH
jgi:hypothetical protein